MKTVNLLIQQWKQKQSELELAGLDKKEAIAITTEKRKYRDLAKLKSMGGPFVSSEEVDSFMDNKDIPDRVKEDRLYIEVRYSRDTSLTLPKASDLFDLKHKYRNLPITTYASNLKVYLSKVSSTAATTWDDFDDAVLWYMD